MITTGLKKYNDFVFPVSFQLADYLNGKHLPLGKIIHIMSKKGGTFKTTFSLLLAVEVQKAGFKVGFVDAEKALDEGLVNNLGVSLDENLWAYSRPVDGEDAYKDAMTMATDMKCRLVIIDSLDACQPSSILEAEFGESNIGQHAKLSNAAVRKFANIRDENDVTFVAINHMGANITNRGAFGHVAKGGAEWSFYADLELDFSREDADSANYGEDTIAILVNLRKNKMGASFRKFTLYAIQGYGFNQSRELLDIAVNKKIVKENKGSYILPGKEKGCRETTASSWAWDNKDYILEFKPGKEKEDGNDKV